MNIFVKYILIGNILSAIIYGGMCLIDCYFVAEEGRWGGGVQNGRGGTPNIREGQVTKVL